MRWPEDYYSRAINCRSRPEFLYVSIVQHDYTFGTHYVFCSHSVVRDIYKVSRYITAESPLEQQLESARDEIFMRVAEGGSVVRLESSLRVQYERVFVIACIPTDSLPPSVHVLNRMQGRLSYLCVRKMRIEKKKEKNLGVNYGEGSGRYRRNSHVLSIPPPSVLVSSSMPYMHFSLRPSLAVRSLSTTSSNDPVPIRGVDVVSVPSGQVVEPSDLAMSALQTSLAAFQAGSAFATKNPFIAPVAGLLLQVLTMLDEVKQYKEECKIVMRKLTRIANVVVKVGKSCEEHNLKEQDLPDGLRTILGSLQRELSGVEHVLKKCATANSVKGFLLRKNLLTKIKQCDGELSNVLEAGLLELLLDMRFAQISGKRCRRGFGLKRFLHRS